MPAAGAGQRQLTTPAPAHMVTVYATEAALATEVAAFVAPALADEGRAVVIASARHLRRFDAALADAGIIDDGDSYLRFDVDTVLSDIVVDGRPEPARLRSLLDPVLAGQRGGRGGVRVYAELAGRLWERGEPTTAVLIEQAAADLAEEASLLVLCSYPAAVLTTASNGPGSPPSLPSGAVPGDGALGDVCVHHTGLVRTGDLPPVGVADTGALGGAVRREEVAYASELRQLRRERDHLRAALQRANDAEVERREVTAAIVHDIRAPATVIAGLTRLLQRSLHELDPERVGDSLTTIERNAERLERLLDDVLSMTRAESPRLRHARFPVDLEAIVADAVDQVRETTDRRIRVTAPPDLPLVIADVDRQLQILHNLLSNAVKFSPPTTAIDVGLTTVGDTVEVRVVDSGRGIATEGRHRLFRPFSRLDTGGEDEVTGSGLGLYLAKLLVEVQGGEIALTSAPGEGTTVSYTVPVYAADVTHAGAGGSADAAWTIDEVVFDDADPDLD